MQRKNLLQKIARWLLRFMQVQLFITTISLPILISWGLPVSILSPLGNLLFAPFLVVFLLLSSTIFFLEVITVPNGLFIYILEKVTICWRFFMSFGDSTRYLIGFCKPHGLILLIIPLLACIIVSNKKTKSVYRSITLLTLLLGVSFFYLKLICPPTNITEQIPCNNGIVTLIKTGGNNIVIDPGCIGRRLSAPSWVEYSFAPLLIKKTGKNCIDHLIVLQPGIITFNYLEKLCSIMTIKNLYLPYWDGALNKSGWRSFFFMKRALEQNSTKLIRIRQKLRKINLRNKKIFTITPLDQTIAYHDATYNAMQVDYQTDDRIISVQSSKYKRPA